MLYKERKRIFSERNKNKFAESPNEILIRCLRKDDFTEWNEWRDNNKGQILLDGIRLGNVNLAGADLSEAKLTEVDLSHANLKGADCGKPI